MKQEDERLLSRCRPERVDDHGHGHDVAPVGKAEGDLGLNHQAAESLSILWAETES